MTLIVVALFSTATFAQDKMESKPAAKPEHKMSHECYMMKDGALMHCTGDKADAQKTAVTLKNGTTVSPSGEVKMKDGKTTKLENGQCISMMGGIGDCDKMHAMLKEHESKMQEQKTK